MTKGVYKMNINTFVNYCVQKRQYFQLFEPFKDGRTFTTVDAEKFSISLPMDYMETYGHIQLDDEKVFIIQITDL